MIFKKIATKKNPIKFSSPLTILSESFPLLREESSRERRVSWSGARGGRDVRTGSGTMGPPGSWRREAWLSPPLSWPDVQRGTDGSEAASSQTIFPSTNSKRGNKAASAASAGTPRARAE